MNPYRVLALAALDFDSASRAALVLALVTLGHVIAVSLRDALTAQVPPVWAQIRSPYRGILAAIAGAAVALFGAVLAGSPWPMAIVAAVLNLGTTVPRLIYAEASTTAQKDAP